MARSGVEVGRLAAASAGTAGGARASAPSSPRESPFEYHLIIPPPGEVRQVGTGVEDTGTHGQTSSGRARTALTPKGPSRSPANSRVEVARRRQGAARGRQLYGIRTVLRAAARRSDEATGSEFPSDEIQTVGNLVKQILDDTDLVTNGASALNGSVMRETYVEAVRTPTSRESENSPSNLKTGLVDPRSPHCAHTVRTVPLPVRSASRRPGRARPQLVRSWKTGQAPGPVR